MNVETAVTALEIRAQALIDANAEFVRFIETCADDEWLLVCPAEGWTVGAVANHIARGHAAVAGWIETIRDGRDVPGSPEQHDANNASMAGRSTFFSMKSRLGARARPFTGAASNFPAPK